MKTVSVIIPFYNAERWILGGVLQDVYKQTFQDIELILINDGSKDNTERILNKEVAEKEKVYTNISHIVIHKENEGIAKTRNLAIEKATGKYLMFLDQDDHIKADYIEQYVREIESKDWDILIGGYQKVTEEGKIIKTFLFDSDDTWAKYQFMAPWGKIYKTSYIKDYAITFLDYRIGEDIYFNLCAYSKMRKIGVFSYVGYRWVQNGKSFSHTKQRDINNVDLSPLFAAILQDANVEYLEEYLSYYFVRELVFRIITVSRGCKKDEVIKYWRSQFQWLREHYPNFEKKLKYPKTDLFTAKAAVLILLWIDRLKLEKMFLAVYTKL